MANQEKRPFQEPTRLWNKWYITILLLSTVSHAAFWLVAPLISKYAVSVGATVAVAAAISSLMSLAALFTRPFAGVFSDRINKKFLIAASGAVSALCMFLYAVSPSVQMLSCVRLLHGVAFSFSSVALLAINTLFIPRDKLGEGIGWSVVSSTLAMAVGPSLGMWLLERFGFTTCFLTAALGCLLPNLAFLLIPYSDAREERATEKRFSLNDFISLRILPYAALTALFSCCSGIANSLLALMGDARGIAGIGAFFTVYSVVTVATRPFTGRLYDRKGVRFLLYPCIGLAALGMLLLGRAAALWTVLLASALCALGQGSGAPTIQAHCLKQLGREKAGVVSSTCYMGSDVGNVLGPMLGGLIVERYGYGTMFLTVAALLLLIGWPLIFFKTRYDEKTYGGAAAPQGS